MKTLLWVFLFGLIAAGVCEQPKAKKQSDKKRSIPLSSDYIFNSGHAYDWNPVQSFGSAGLVDSGAISYGLNGLGVRSLGLTGSLGVSQVSPAVSYSSNVHHTDGLVASGGYGSGFGGYTTLPHSSVVASFGSGIDSAAHLGVAGISNGYKYGAGFGTGNAHLYNSAGALGLAHGASYGLGLGAVGTDNVKETHQYRQVTQHVPVSIPHPVPVPVTRTVNVPHPVKVDVPQPYPVPVKVPVPYDVPKPYAVKVPQPVPVAQPVKVPVDVPKPYPVYHTKQVKVEVEKPVFVKQAVEVKVPVPKPYPVEIPTPVHVRVPHPVFVKEAHFVNNADAGLNAAHFGNSYRFGSANYGLDTASAGLATTNYGLNTANVGLVGTGYGLSTADYGLKTATLGGIPCEIPVTGGASFHSLGANSGFGSGALSSGSGNLHSLGGATSFGTSGILGDSSYFAGLNSGSLGSTGSTSFDQSGLTSGFVGSGFNFASAAADSGVHQEGDAVSVTSAAAKASVGTVDSENTSSTPTSISSDSTQSGDAPTSADSGDSESNNIEVVKVNDGSEK
ncbi:unnamed protein product [Callosobruchus maculatus]|uniref:Uncharacterized protein n=1 Tax=Callosobruchus maculatus TaxID=64391 RepID=A0A653C0A7_CALMS|nr:unnamed protein product [Callosobruchus maculatus]